MLKRTAENHLLEWYQKKRRKPLVLRGARPFLQPSLARRSLGVGGSLTPIFVISPCPKSQNGPIRLVYAFISSGCLIRPHFTIMAIKEFYVRICTFYVL